MYNEMCPPNSTQHVVTRGDTYWKLSLTYGVSVQSISDANPGVNADNLQIGSTLCIPTAPNSTVSPTPSPPTTPMKPTKSSTRPVSCPEGTFPYTIQVGDTYWKLSLTYGVSVQSISDANPGVNADNLQIGSTLCIPTAPNSTVSPTLSPPTTPMKPTKPSTRPVSCPEGTFPYTIQVGDTYWKLSLTYGVSVQSISDANPGVNADNLQIGSTLCIPTAPKSTVSPTPSPPTTPMKPTPLPTPAPSAPTTPPAPVPSTPPAAPGPSTSPAPPSVSPSDFEYLIEKCDSICGIARKFYVSVESILQRNPGIDPRCLQEGTFIYVPINCCGKNTCRYVVRAGDTLNRIANKFNVCPPALIAANPNIDFQHLVRCQIICIPDA